jgi:hypothetical protein
MHASLRLPLICMDAPAAAMVSPLYVIMFMLSDTGVACLHRGSSMEVDMHDLSSVTARWPHPDWVEFSRAATFQLESMSCDGQKHACALRQGFPPATQVCIAIQC